MGKVGCVWPLRPQGRADSSLCREEADRTKIRLESLEPLMNGWGRSLGAARKQEGLGSPAAQESREGRRGSYFDKRT